MQKLPGLIEINNNPTELSVWDQIVGIIDEKPGIIGYQFPSLGVVNKDEISTFFIRSVELGIILFQLIDGKVNKIIDDEFWEINENEVYSPDIILTNFYQEIKNRLSKDTILFNRKEEKLVFEVRRFLIFYGNTRIELEGLYSFNQNIINDFIARDELDEKLLQIFNNKNYGIKQELIDNIDSLLEGTDSYSKARREKLVSEPKTIQDYLKMSLENTFKLDEIQRSVAMQIPAGPQRIRGLAGTGKTIILCLKAALAHKMFPNFKILFVFNTQSMYSNIERNIQNYFIRETKSMINTDKLEILHAWGGKTTKKGLYSSICDDLDIKPLTLYDLNRSSDSLDKIYLQLLQNHKSDLTPKYDLVLVDEAQDFYPSMFEVLFLLTKGDETSKRIVWAYDEFQSLKDLKIREPEDLFGTKISGEPNMPNTVLEGEYRGGIKKDFVLPNSYRNPRITLMVAHGVGLGLYTSDLKLPMRDRTSWIARGYEVKFPPKKQVFVKGDKLQIERPEKYSRNNLETLLSENHKDDKKLIQLFEADNSDEELIHVRDKIYSLVVNQNVEPEEIIVITLDNKNSEVEFASLRSMLNQLSIKCTTPGYVESSDKFKEAGRVTLTTPFRAKGNEANIVFVIHCEKVINDYSGRARNSFFVSVTRSRGWCYLSCVGKGTSLKTEIDSIKLNYPQFVFTFPDRKQLEEREKVISTSDSKIDQYESELNSRMKDEAYRALLLEKIANDPELLKEIQKKK